MTLGRGGWIEINEQMRTSAPGVYAIGDVTGKLALAHVAQHMGIAAAEAIAGLEVEPIIYEDMPRATYCSPRRPASVSPKIKRRSGALASA